jgi:hypothetical protein
MLITAVPITKLFAGGMGPVRNPVLQHRMRLFSLVPVVWESNPKLQGGWCKDEPTDNRGSGAHPGHVCVCCFLGRGCCCCLLLQYLIQSCERGGEVRTVEDMCYEML